MRLGCFVCSLLCLAGTFLGQSSPVPFINQPLVPTSGTPGSPGLTLTVNGTGYVSSSVVNWNGSPRATTFVSGSQLQATISSTDTAGAGTASVTVTNPTPGGGVSNTVFFQITPPTSTVTFAMSSFAAGFAPRFITAADFNGDQKLDLVVVNTFVNTVSILLGNGDGTFGAPVSFPTGARPSSATKGDFNADGFLDLAVANAGDNTVSVLQGNGDGTFQPATTYPVGNNPSGVIAADFNADGHLDLVVANAADNTVSVLLGNGDGTFQTAASLATGSNPSALIAADFNRDGVLDLAVANTSDNTISVLLGNGDGTFRPLSPLATGSAPVSLALGDFNGDGVLDLVASNSNDNTVSLLLGNGDGTFQSGTVFPTGMDPSSLRHRLGLAAKLYRQSIHSCTIVRQPTAGDNEYPPGRNLHQLRCPQPDHQQHHDHRRESRRFPVLRRHSANYARRRWQHLDCCCFCSNRIRGAKRHSDHHRRWCQQPPLRDPYRDGPHSCSHRQSCAH